VEAPRLDLSFEEFVELGGGAPVHTAQTSH
jgi:hypothetical protein